MIKLCVFDMDGTLVDTIADIAAATNHALSKNGLTPHPLADYYRFVGHGTQVLLEMASGCKKGEPIFSALFEDYHAYYHAHFADNSRVYDGIYRLLSALGEKGIAAAVYSNKTESVLRQVTAKFFPDAAFEAVIGIIDGRAVKPDPGALLALIDRLRLQKDEVLYLGDSDVDVMTAKNAGVACVSAGWGFSGVEELKAAGAERICASPLEVLPLL